jgi:hypothetical protein
MKLSFGPLVKRLRQRPLTPLTWVRVPHGSPFESGNCSNDESSFLRTKTSCCWAAILVGTDCSEGTPVPIPNTEVKLTCADDTWLVTAWDNRWRQHEYSSLAQPVEHAAVNRRVVGSSPTRGARKSTCLCKCFFVIHMYNFAISK